MSSTCNFVFVIIDLNDIQHKHFLDSGQFDNRTFSLLMYKYTDTFLHLFDSSRYMTTTIMTTDSSSHANMNTADTWLQSF